MKNNNNNKKEVKNSKRVIDLTSYINPAMLQADSNGSYTGTTKDTYYDGEYEQPVQDADDL